MSVLEKPGHEQFDVEPINKRDRQQPLYAARKKIHPKRAEGTFRRLKWVVMAVTLGIYYLAPWLRWDRGEFAPDQAILIDLFHRRFYFFFIELWPQEFYYVAGLLVMAGVGLFLITSSVGRAWCGYTCPQTVWVDLFLVVERAVEGDRNDTSSASSSKSDDDKKTREARFLKLYTVFNACQIDGIAFPEPPKCPSFTESDMGAQARSITEQMPNPPIIHVGRKAYPHYIPDDDTVHMPTRESFRSEYRFHKTLFHELAHATGHPTRLNRTTLVENRGMYAVGEDKKIYCLEELTAEMAAAFLATHAEIVEDDLQQSAAYLKGWLDVLRVPDHKNWLIKAASEAQKAADYILGEERNF